MVIYSMMILSASAAAAASASSAANTEAFLNLSTTEVEAAVQAHDKESTPSASAAAPMDKDNHFGKEAKVNLEELDALLKQREDKAEVLKKQQEDRVEVLNKQKSTSHFVGERETEGKSFEKRSLMMKMKHNSAMIDQYKKQDQEMTELRRESLALDRHVLQLQRELLENLEEQRKGNEEHVRRVNEIHDKMIQDVEHYAAKMKDLAESNNRFYKEQLAQLSARSSWSSWLWSIFTGRRQGKKEEGSSKLIPGSPAQDRESESLALSSSEPEPRGKLFRTVSRKANNQGETKSCTVAAAATVLRSTVAACEPLQWKELWSSLYEEYNFFSRKFGLPIDEFLSGNTMTLKGIMNVKKQKASSKNEGDRDQLDKCFHNATINLRDYNKDFESKVEPNLMSCEVQHSVRNSSITSCTNDNGNNRDAKPHLLVIEHKMLVEKFFGRADANYQPKKSKQDSLLSFVYGKLRKSASAHTVVLMGKVSESPVLEAIPDDDPINFNKTMLTLEAQRHQCEKGSYLLKNSHGKKMSLLGKEGGKAAFEFICLTKEELDEVVYSKLHSMATFSDKMEL